MIMNSLLNYFTFFLFISNSLTNVLELNEKFLDIYQNDHTRSFIIKFYAPWCHHCRAIEKMYDEVGALVKQIGNPNIIVGKIDCSKYTSIASHFGVRGFPTIMYIDSNRKIEFLADRNKNELLEFIKRLSGPAVRKLTTCDDLKKLKKEHMVFFVNFAKKPASNYSEIANQFHSTTWFYFLEKECSNYDFNSIYSIKTSSRSNTILKKYNPNLQTLRDWVKIERFPKFIQIGMTNIQYLMNANKLLAIALIKESKTTKFATEKDREYFEILEQQAIADIYGNQFVYGWTNQLDMINSIAIQSINPIPNFIFINSSTMNFYLFNTQFERELTREENEIRLIEVLDSFVNNKPILTAQGGNTYWNKIRRLGYDGFVTISLMFESNPILTVILFGLPITFFSIIIYCSCCSDMLDGKIDEEEEEDEEYSIRENYETNEELIEENYELNNEDRLVHLKND